MPPNHPHPRQRTLAAHHLRLAALEWRPGAPRRVLAVHGWLDNAASFAPLAPLLEDCHVVAVDLPGHGRSAHRPRGVAYHFVDYVGDALAAADALGWENFDLLGHSLGASVCALSAAAASERVGGLVLLEGLGPITADTASATVDPAAQLGKSISQAARAAAGGAPQRRYPTLAEVIAARRAAGAISAPAAELLVRRNLMRGADGYRWRTDRRLRAPSPVYLAETQVREFLQRIGCPSLLVIGRQSPVLSAAMLARRRKWVAGLRVAHVDGGHHLHMDSPAAVARVVNEFYREHGQPDANRG